MRKYNIMVDIDGVVFNLLKRYCHFYNRDFGKGVQWDAISVYDMTETFKLLGKDVYRYLRRPDFYRSKQYLLPHAVASINYLNKIANVFFITATVTHESARAKSVLLNRCFDWYGITKHYICSSRKSIIKLPRKIIIDDSPAVFDYEKGAIKICYAWKYNRHLKDKVDLYTDDWVEIVEFIKRRVK